MMKTRKVSYVQQDGETVEIITVKRYKNATIKNDRVRCQVSVNGAPFEYETLETETPFVTCNIINEPIPSGTGFIQDYNGFFVSVA